MKSAFGLFLVTAIISTILIAQTKSSAGNAAAGKQVYVGTCSTCHGADGKGTSTGRAMGVKDLHSAEAVKLTTAQMKQVISNGKGNMPPWKTQLSAEQISDVAAFVRTMQKNK